MTEHIPHVPTMISIVVLTMLSACATGQLPVVKKLDELTAVTITYNRTAITMSPDRPFDQATINDYVQIGAIEVNRAGTLHYYLWLGISDRSRMTSAIEGPEEYESIVLVIDGEKIQLDVHGWTAAAIGASETVYKKFYKTSVDAYYQVNLDHIQLLADANSLELHTTGPASKEFVPWHSPAKTKDELAEFLRTVLQ